MCLVCHLWFRAKFEIIKVVLIEGRRVVVSQISINGRNRMIYKRLKKSVKIKAKNNENKLNVNTKSKFKKKLVLLTHKKSANLIVKNEC